MSVLCYFGKTGSGKSHKAKEKIKEYKKRIIFDITPSKSFRFGKEKDGGIECKNGIEHNNYSLRSLEELLVELIEKDEFTLIFRPSTEIDWFAIGEAVCSFAMRLGDYYDKDFNENIVLVLDELDKYVSTTKQSFIARAIGMGRHSHLDLFCISQVPSQLPKVIRDNASVEHFFQLGLNDYYQKKLGDEISNKLASGDLPEYSYYLKVDGDNPKLYNKNGKLL
tara:strand:+ start:23812 stop:24480 length:669 start_codon:yes stop_codon:yes gene_type:complete